MGGEEVGAHSGTSHALDIRRRHRHQRILGTEEEEGWGIAATDVLQTVRCLSESLAQNLAAFRSHPHVSDVRQCGLIGAIEFVRDRATRTPFDWRERRNLRIYRHALQRGVILRPLGNVIYFMPPYVVTPAEIALMCTVASEGLELATCD